MRMNAYHYGFTPTGIDPIDKILSAVCCAGKAYHHTEDWNKDNSAGIGFAEGFTGPTPVDWIQNAANEAAELFRKQRLAADSDATTRE